MTSTNVQLLQIFLSFYRTVSKLDSWRPARGYLMPGSSICVMDLPAPRTIPSLHGNGPTHLRAIPCWYRNGLVRATCRPTAIVALCINNKSKMQYRAVSLRKLELFRFEGLPPPGMSVSQSVSQWNAWPATGRRALQDLRSCMILQASLALSPVSSSICCTYVL